MRIPVTGIVRLLVAIPATIIAVHTFFTLSPRILPWDVPIFLISRFDINAEGNLPTWYSVVLLFSVAMAAFLLYQIENRTHRDRGIAANFWLGFSCVYLFLSLDEAAQIHETVGMLTNKPWYFTYAPLTALFFLACVYHLFVSKRVNPSLRNWVIAGLVVYGAGGLVCEWLYNSFQWRYAWQLILVVVEEGSEYLGTSMVLTGLLIELNKHIEITIRGVPIHTEVAQRIDN